MPKLLGRTRLKTEEGRSILRLVMWLLTVAIYVIHVPEAAGQDTDTSFDRHVDAPGSYNIQGSILSDEALLQEAEAGLFHLYNMEYEAADSIFRSIESQFPEHPMGPFLRSLVLWWRILPELESGAEADDEAFYAAMAEVIKRSDRLLDEDDQDFDAMFFKGAALGFRGRLLSNRHEWLSAAKDGKKALEYIFDIADADTANADFQFGTGVYNYFAAVIPKKYPVVKPILYFFPDADREDGLSSLKFTAREGRLIRTEAAYFLLQIYLIYEPQFEEAVRYSSWLIHRYPDNAFFRVLEGRVYVRFGRLPRAMYSFERVIDGHGEGRPGYTDALSAVSHYYRGRYRMNGKRFDDALISFMEVETLSASQPVDSYFRVHALLRMGMIYDLLGVREDALAAYGRVLRLDDQAESHEKASLFRKEPYQSR